jgi:Tol biopolymer transport system component
MCLLCGLGFTDFSQPSRRRFLASTGATAAAVTLAGPAAFRASAVAQDVKDPPTRSITISTKEVTDPDVAVSPDGRWLVFTALGHLFQLPTTGGATKQLTSGPFYDSEPAISPDGTRVAFISDRKVSSQGNVFVLDLASGQIRQVTDEFWVDSPVWSPDGKSIAFLSYQVAGPLGNYWFVGPRGLHSQARRIWLEDGKVDMLTPPDYVRAVAFLADGRPVWSVTEPEARGRPASSQLKVLNEAGKTTIALTVEGVVDHIGVEPGDARGLYLRLYESVLLPRAIFPQPEHIAYVSLGDRGPQAIAGLLSRPAQLTHEVEDRGAGARVYTAQLSNPFPRPAFGVGKGAVYLGDKGSLWRVDTATGTRKKVEFSADIAFEFFPGSPPPTYSETRAASPTSILTPRLAPDGKSVIFTAAGFVWREALAGGAAQRLLDSRGFEWGPAALSPDGKKLAYQLSEDNYQELRVVDLASGHDSCLVREYRSWRYEPAWSPDGTKLVYTRVVPAPNPLTPAVPTIFLADLASGKSRTVATGNDRWQPAPQFSRDGKVYFTSEGQMHRCSIDNPRDCESITALRGFVDNGQVSPDGKWLAFRRNDEIWVAPRNTGIVKEDAAYRFSASGGRDFSFTPDGTSLVYSVGAEVWLQPLGHDNKSPDKKTKVGVQIRLSAESPPPFLLRNIRVLDFNAGGFTEPTALMVED